MVPSFPKDGVDLPRHDVAVRENDCEAGTSERGLMRSSLIRAERAEPAPDRAARLLQWMQQVRSLSVQLVEPLSAEDCAVQSMPDASPAKWHLAHTTWFFETFVLLPHAAGYAVFDAAYNHLFNSYYESAGTRHPRPLRGLLTRPDLGTVLAYRGSVDRSLDELLQSAVPAEVLDLVELGLHHERQHQELLLTDIKHLLSCNPLKPAYQPIAASSDGPRTAALQGWIEGPAGRVEIGHASSGFAFDLESPRHSRWLQPYVLATRPVSNAGFREFIEDGGYRHPALWLSDGWRLVQERGWRRPFYWDDSLQAEFTLRGLQPIDPDAPVCHVSYYEAEAYARWRGARLPTEDEWEAIAAGQPFRGNFLESGRLHPVAGNEGETGLFGDVWEWTGSAFLPYPGFVPGAGGVGEYNGKFMVNQMVLRGGSCLSHSDHIRPGYRNFFYPDAQWQATGIRLARSI